MRWCWVAWLSVLSVAVPQTAPPSVAIVRRLGLEGRVMWVDATANLHWLIDRAQIRQFVQRCREAGINCIVLDVKPISGHVLYNSRVALKLTEWRGVRVPPDLDVLQVFLEEAHAVGLEVHANINVLSEGHKLFGVGPAYENPDWQMVAYSRRRMLVLPDGSRYDLSRFDAPPPADGVAAYRRSAAPTPPAGRQWSYALLTDDLRVQAVIDGMFVSRPITPPENGWILVADGQAAQSLERLSALGIQLSLQTQPVLQPIAESDTEGIAVFVNPLHPEVRARLLAIVRELVQNYPIDGLVLDRMRWANVYTDFSERTRAAFEAQYGRVVLWPDDIIRPPALPYNSYERGVRFGEWVEFRARVIRDLLRDIRRTVEAIRPIPIGVYVGSWYPIYYELGVNWASDALARPYSFVSPEYRLTSYLHDVDYLMPGVYFGIPFMSEAPLHDSDEVRTVEGMTRRVMEWTNGELFVYAGIYTLDYRGDPAGFERAIRAARLNSHGVMIFDASYIVQWDWWEVVRRGLGTPDGARTEVPLAPHQLPSLLPSLRNSGY
ncbi:MAG: family 10 glycosylhydrolase [Fimbriimonadales bacterium]|nr:family 10 glycosylhydrolase [Fimbriimonadales bacterium]MDW8052318.1 alpha amylase family protein [Armatimonadota bacterium]